MTERIGNICSGYLGVKFLPYDDLALVGINKTIIPSGPLKLTIDKQLQNHSFNTARKEYRSYMACSSSPEFLSSAECDLLWDIIRSEQLPSIAVMHLV